MNKDDLVQATAENDLSQCDQLHAVPTAITEGSEFYFVPKSRYRAREYLTVTKVGRKWLTLSNGERADKVTLELEDGWNTGRLYPSQEQYQAIQAAEDLWRAFRAVISQRWGVPKGIAEKDIRHVAGLLKIELPE